MKKGIFIFIILLQISFIFYLAFNIYQKKKQVLVALSINPISKDKIISTPSGELKYFYEPAPNSRVIKDLGFMGEEFNYTVEYRINSDRLNQLVDYPIEKKKNVYRIVTLGDSFTFGTNVNTEENYPSQLQKVLDSDCRSKIKYEVLNLGDEGYDIQYSAERMKIRGLKYNPDLVVWFLINADFDRFAEKIPQKEKELSSVMHKTGEYESMLKQGKFYPAWYKAKLAIVEELGGEDKVLEIQKKYIEEVSSFYKNNLVLFSLSGDLPQKYKNILKSIVKEYPHMYMHDDGPDIYKRNSYFPDSHPNKRGYGLIAVNIFNYLKKEKLISCN